MVRQKQFVKPNISLNGRSLYRRSFTVFLYNCSDPYYPVAVLCAILIERERKVTRYPEDRPWQWHPVPLSEKSTVIRVL